MNEEDIAKFLPTDDPPNPALLEQISGRLSASLKPIRPLPSNGVLWAISIAIFAVLSLTVASLKGLFAVAALSVGEKTLYYGVIFLLAGLFARALIERMIPGAKHLIRPALLSILAPTLLGVLMFVLFQDRGIEAFVEHGKPCLVFGSFTALIGGLVGWPLLIRGYLVSPAETITVYGFFAGLLGIAALSLHCPIRNSLHFLVWHLGVILLAGLAGILLGVFWENRGYAD
jgi:hypothetical protein